ncbi:hypothetical protein AVEN_116222-1 [Araneus ventricosus]|uniref:Uncharacterized protein n=1 Tax=Araneus ventricosus TaxID=182803 RepID=A0A4Y2I135_ARAVE|nr:hypothetical protein AVEN_116222-1 [Araneus ventricosus]
MTNSQLRPIRHKLLLYKFTTRSNLLYGPIIYRPVAITRQRKLQVFQNQQLLRIVNAPNFHKRVTPAQKQNDKQSVVPYQAQTLALQIYYKIRPSPSYMEQ